MVQLQCAQCGQVYARIQRQSKFCSHACYVASRTRPLSDFFIEEPGTGCWVWLGVRNRGYGQITRKALKGRVPMKASRLFYERIHGPIPNGLTIEHVCKNPPCVNPAHLTLLTAAENARRAQALPACGRCGGPWRQTARGQNWCPTCIRAYQQRPEYKARKAERRRERAMERL